MQDHDELFAAMIRTHQEFIRLTAEFHKLTKGIPSGIPAPDGELVIKNASRDLRHASDEYLAAVEAFTKAAMSRR